MRRSGGLRWLVAAARAVLASSAMDADAIDVCSAEQVTAQDPGCPPGDGLCTITLPLDLIDSPTCQLDFGLRDVRLQGTLDSTGTVSLTTGALTIDPGGSIRAPRISIAAQGDVAVRRVAGSAPGLLDVSGFDGGELTLSTPGRFLLDGRIDADAGGAGKYAGRITIEATAGITTGPGSLLSADAPISDEGTSLFGGLALATAGPIVLQGTVTLRGASAGDEQIGGDVAIRSASLRLAPDAVLRGGTIDAEIEGDVRIEREGARRALIQADAAYSAISIVTAGDLLVAGEVSTDGSTCERGTNILSLRADGALTVTTTGVLRASGVPDPGEDLVCSGYTELEGVESLLFEGTLVQFGSSDPEGDAYIIGGDVTVRGRIRMDGWYQRSDGGSLNFSGSERLILDAEITTIAGPSTLGVERGGYSGNVAIYDTDEILLGGSIVADGPLYGSAGLISIEGTNATVTATLSARSHRVREYSGRVHFSVDALDFRGSIDVSNGGEVLLLGEELLVGGRITAPTQLDDRRFAGFLDPRIVIGDDCDDGRVTLTGEIDVSAFGCQAGECATPWRVELAAGEVTLAPSAVIENTGRVGGRITIAGEQLALAGRIDVSGSEADGSVAVARCAGAEQPACAITAEIEPPSALVNGCLLPTPTSSVPPAAPTATATPSATPLPSATIAAAGCPGDCDGDGLVENTDLMRALDLVNLCQGNAGGCAAAPAPCAAADLDRSAAIGAGELSRVVGTLGTICD